jgi:hypothetical protein
MGVSSVLEVVVRRDAMGWAAPAGTGLAAAGSTATAIAPCCRQRPVQQDKELGQSDAGRLVPHTRPRRFWSRLLTLLFW